MKSKDLLGRHGEDLAAGFLEALGMLVVERNWRCAEGEIDIVALDGDALVIKPDLYPAPLADPLL